MTSAEFENKSRASAKLWIDKSANTGETVRINAINIEEENLLNDECDGSVKMCFYAEYWGTTKDGKKWVVQIDPTFTD